MGGARGGASLSEIWMLIGPPMLAVLLSLICKMKHHMRDWGNATDSGLSSRILLGFFSLEY